MHRFVISASALISAILINTLAADTVNKIEESSIQDTSTSRYTDVAQKYYDYIISNQSSIDTADNLSFLLMPLTELSLDYKYILSDFRESPVTPSTPNDISSLRLYVREKSQKRPEPDYFNMEYGHYLICQRNKSVYLPDSTTVPYLPPFNKITFKYSPIAVWEAYLLHCTERFIGMRNEANYNKETFILSQKDIDKITDNIKNQWDTDCFENGSVKTSSTANGQRRIKNILTLIDSLKNIEPDSLEPVITENENSVTIEHYAFAEFAGLIRLKTVLYLNESKSMITKIKSNTPSIISPYRRNIYY